MLPLHRSYAFTLLSSILSTSPVAQCGKHALALTRPFIEQKWHNRPPLSSLPPSPCFPTYPFHISVMNLCRSDLPQQWPVHSVALINLLVESIFFIICCFVSQKTIVLLKWAKNLGVCSLCLNLLLKKPLLSNFLSKKLFTLRVPAFLRSNARIRRVSWNHSIW